jgi:hypothetical protein
MCFIDLDPCEVWDERERKARKEHKCGACGKTIRVGETYLTHFSVFEGNANSEKMCFPCRDDRKQFADAHDGTLMTPSFLRQMVAECISEGDEESERQWKPLLDRIDSREQES